MDNFDIDKYVERTFKGFSMYSDNDAWPDLSSELDHLQGRKRSRRIHIKIALLIVLMISAPSSINKNEEVHEILKYKAGKMQTAVVESGLQILNGVEKASKPILREQSTSAIGDIGKVSTTTQLERKKEGRVNKNEAKEKKATSQVPEENKKDLAGLAINKFDEVTDAEIDSLMGMARQNIQRERALQEARSAFTYKMLAEVEKEIGTEDKGFYEVVKRNFAKFQTVISN